VRETSNIIQNLVNFLQHINLIISSAMNEQLLTAAKGGDVELVKRLLDDGANKDYQDGVSQYLYSLSCLSMFNK